MIQGWQHHSCIAFGRQEIQHHNKTYFHDVQRASDLYVSLAKACIPLRKEGADVARSRRGATSALVHPPATPPGATAAPAAV